jgi:hypothetical protein
VLAAVLASVWGLRLAGYLYVDRIRGQDEDGRYRELRAKWGARASSRFFWFFQFQALFVVFFSLPFALVCLDPDRAISALAWAGVAVWAIGNVGTIVADRQLAVWRANPANHGKTARTGSGAGRATQLLLRVGELVRRRLVATTAPRDGSLDGPGRPPLPALPRDAGFPPRNGRRCGAAPTTPSTSARRVLRPAPAQTGLRSCPLTCCELAQQ